MTMNLKFVQRRGFAAVPIFRRVMGNGLQYAKIHDIIAILCRSGRVTGTGMGGLDWVLAIVTSAIQQKQGDAQNQ